MSLTGSRRRMLFNDAAAGASCDFCAQINRDGEPMRAAHFDFKVTAAAACKMLLPT